MKRRNFIFDIFSVGIVSAMSTKLRAANLNFPPMVRSISTWKTTEANQKAGQMLNKGEHALDAAVAGVAIEEENPKNTTVGYGGAPDRTGKVTLDACVMNHLGDCGSVVAVENIVNVARLAKDVMEKTPHVMLAGKGAEELAKTVVNEIIKQDNLVCLILAFGSNNLKAHITQKSFKLLKIKKGTCCYAIIKALNINDIIDINLI